MTEFEMLEIEKYWRENCCNRDKEHTLPDGYANCKLTGTLCFAQESGKECKCFNVPPENLIVVPCKVGDKVYCFDEGKVVELYVRNISIDENGLNIAICFENEPRYGYCFRPDRIGKSVFFNREEAEQALVNYESSKNDIARKEDENGKKQ